MAADDCFFQHDRDSRSSILREQAEAFRRIHQHICESYDPERKLSDIMSDMLEDLECGEVYSMV